MSTLSLSDQGHSITELASQSSLGSFQLVDEPVDEPVDTGKNDQQTKADPEEAALLMELASLDDRGVSASSHGIQAAQC